MPKKRPERRFSEGYVPLLSVEGTARECGIQLGYAWMSALTLKAEGTPPGTTPWWKLKRFKKLISRYAPHLPDIYRGMARGAGIPENKISTQILPEGRDECTSFAVQPSATLDGEPISGQTKDTQDARVFQYIVLRMKMKDAPSALTLTYPGWLFGHGFVEGGCSIFRNSMYAGQWDGELPYDIWGILALHCGKVDEVVELTRRYGVQVGGHCTVADSRGGIVGIETGKNGFAVLKPKRGIYTHANHVVSSALLKKTERYKKNEKNCSMFRMKRLRERLETERGRLTAQLAYAALCDHENYPASICRHGAGSNTTASVIVEPTKGLLHATRSTPCHNWPRTYALQA